MLRMAGARLPKGCAKHSGQSLDVKAMRPFPRDFDSVARFLRFGESKFGAAATMARQSGARAAFTMAASHPLASSGFTHSNTGSWCLNQVNWRLA